MKDPKKCIELMRNSMTAYEVSEEEIGDLMNEAVHDGLPVIADPVNDDMPRYAYVEDGVMGGLSVLRINGIFPQYYDYALCGNE